MPRRRYDIAWHMADQYKWMAKIFFILQLLVAWSIVVLSTLYASWDALSLLRARNRGYYVGGPRNALREPRNRHVIGLLRAHYVHVIGT